MNLRALFLLLWAGSTLTACINLHVVFPQAAPLNQPESAAPVNKSAADRADPPPAGAGS
jgi:hypothetical protein